MIAVRAVLAQVPCALPCPCELRRKLRRGLLLGGVYRPGHLVESPHQRRRVLRPEQQVGLALGLLVPVVRDAAVVQLAVDDVLQRRPVLDGGELVHVELRPFRGPSRLPPAGFHAGGLAALGARALARVVQRRLELVRRGHGRRPSGVLAHAQDPVEELLARVVAEIIRHLEILSSRLPDAVEDPPHRGAVLLRLRRPEAGPVEYHRLAPLKHSVVYARAGEPPGILQLRERHVGGDHQRPAAAVARVHQVESLGVHVGRVPLGAQVVDDHQVVGADALKHARPLIALGVPEHVFRPGDAGHERHLAVVDQEVGQAASCEGLARARRPDQDKPVACVKKFDENKENTVAVSRNNLLGKWYISFNYPFWKIKEYDSSAEADKAVQSGEADCFVVKAGQSLKTLEDSKMRSIFLTKSGASCFAVTRENTTLMNILNKTIQTLPASRLSSQFYVYENAPGKVTLAEYIKDNLRVVSIWFVSVVLIIVWIIVYLLIQARKAKIQAEKANAAKSEFLFNMSHDIRTPMNALLGYSELIKRELTDPKLLDYQEKMEQSGNLLLSIINNVLDMARIESGKVELDEDYVKIRDIYQGIYKIFQAEAEKKCIHLKMEYDVKHEHVICDETKNKEIFLNLISNAVKYTASGGRVTIRITELDCDRKDYVRIRTQVIDTGIGMSEEFLPSLFEAFARERNTTDGKIAGTGLGMPIIKKYIDMMYGTIEVESKQGEGSKFTVTLEYRIADKSYYEQDTEKSSDVDETDRISGKHILLAEDNDLNAEIAQFILEDMGLMVDRVEDGVQCVSRIEQKPAGTYDLILMDIQMPNMDGYRATEMIRGLSDKDKATIPIIAMTANAFEEDRKKALAKGMNGHIAKPVDAEKVEKTICSVLGSQSEQ